MHRFAVATLALSLAFLTAAPSLAQEGETERKLVFWKVTHDETQATSYLFGTIHVPDKRVLDLPKPVKEGFDAADALYCELALEPSLQMEATKHLMLPAGQSLGDVVGKDLLERAGKLLAAKGFPLAPLQRLKPWAFISQLQQLDFLPELQSGIQPLDAMLYNKAKAAGKTVGGLEKLSDQIAVFDSLSAETQKKMFASGIEELEKAAKEKRKVTEPIIAAYLAGDIEKILEENAEENEGDPELEAFGKKLLEDRNVTMAEGMHSLMTKSPDKAHFFAVGAAHYPGEKGIVALLKAKGYTVTRVER